ncbi:MAG: hypothetical protein LJE89_01550 [Deltaproteobacteria bacterium]|nr:hypothetical protein [Deltaproteobacteria bacterium]
MNCCSETMKMDVPARHREPARSGEAGGPPGIRRLLVLRLIRSGTSQEPTAEDARKNDHIQGRSKRSMKHPG